MMRSSSSYSVEYLREQKGVGFCGWRLIKLAFQWERRVSIEAILGVEISVKERLKMKMEVKLQQTRATRPATLYTVLSRSFWSADFDLIFNSEAQQKHSSVNVPSGVKRGRIKSMYKSKITISEVGCYTRIQIKRVFNMMKSSPTKSITRTPPFPF